MDLYLIRNILKNEGMFHHSNLFGFLRSLVNSRDMREMIKFNKYILVFSILWVKVFIFLLCHSTYV